MWLMKYSESDACAHDLHDSGWLHNWPQHDCWWSTGPGRVSWAGAGDVGGEGVAWLTDVVVAAAEGVTMSWGRSSQTRSMTPTQRRWSWSRQEIFHWLCDWWLKPGAEYNELDPMLVFLRDVIVSDTIGDCARCDSAMINCDDSWEESLGDKFTNYSKLSEFLLIMSRSMLNV